MAVAPWRRAPTRRERGHILSSASRVTQVLDRAPTAWHIPGQPRVVPLGRPGPDPNAERSRRRRPAATPARRRPGLRPPGPHHLPRRRRRPAAGPRGRTPPGHPAVAVRTLAGRPRARGPLPHRGLHPRARRLHRAASARPVARRPAPPGRQRHQRPGLPASGTRAGRHTSAPRHRRRGHPTAPSISPDAVCTWPARDTRPRCCAARSRPAHQGAGRGAGTAGRDRHRDGHRGGLPGDHRLVPGGITPRAPHRRPGGDSRQRHHRLHRGPRPPPHRPRRPLPRPPRREPPAPHRPAPLPHRRHRPAPAAQPLGRPGRIGPATSPCASRSVEAELVALDVLHHQARLVVLVGQQQPHADPAEGDEAGALGL